MNREELDGLEKGKSVVRMKGTRNYYRYIGKDNQDKFMFSGSAHSWTDEEVINLLERV